MKAPEAKALLVNMAGKRPTKQHPSKNIDLLDPAVSSKTLPFEEVWWSLRRPFYPALPRLLARSSSLWGRPTAQYTFFRLGHVVWCWNRQPYQRLCDHTETVTWWHPGSLRGECEHSSGYPLPTQSLGMKGWRNPSIILLASLCCLVLPVR